MRYEACKNWLEGLHRAATRQRLLVVLGLFAGLLFSTSCSEMPTSPGGDFDLGNGLGTNAVKPPLASNPQWTVQQLIPASGGTMLLDGGKVICVFPSGSLPDNEAVTITAKMKLNGARGSATRIEFDFQPAMEFEEPILLKLHPDYLAGTSNKLFLWFFDPELWRWVEQDHESINPDRMVTFKLFHYSGYAVSR
jgi:hypothetical protein